MSSDSISRREFVHRTAAAGAVCALGLAPRARSSLDTTHEARVRFGYAAITWGGHDRQAIEDIAGLGFRGIQLRANVLGEFGNRPGALTALLDQKRLTLVAFSSGSAPIDLAKRKQTIAEHVAHARFVHDVGGLFLQVTDERPTGRDVTADDCARLGALLTDIGRQTAAVGIPLAYHPHMGTIGERPENSDRVLAASDPSVVKLLLDVAHYAQGGGDPAAAIRRHHERLALLHIKDVERVSPPDGRAEDAYRFVELGRGSVDLPAVFAALRAVRFEGWGVVELDSVPVSGRSPAESAAISKHYLVSHGLWTT